MQWQVKGNMRYGLAAAALLAFSFVLQTAFFMEQHGSPTETFFRDNAAFDSSRFLADARVIETDGLYDGAPRRQLHAVYPLIIAGFETAFGRAPVALLLFQALLNCAMFFMVWRLARRWFGEVVALAALFLCVFYLSFVFYAGVWLREIVVVFLAVTVLALLDEMELRGGRWQFAVAAGVAAGLLMETRPYPILLVLVVAALLLALARRQITASAVAAFAAGCFAVMMALPGPGVAGEGGPLAHFLSGNVLDGAYGYLWLTTPTKERLLAESGGGAVRGLWLFLGEIAHQPLPYAAFYFKKLRMLFGDFAIPSNYNIYLFKEELSFVLHVPFVTFGLIFPFAAVGLWEGWRGRRGLRRLYLFTFALTLGVFIFPIQERYRLIMVPFFIIFAAAGMAALYDSLRAGNARKGAYLSALFLAALLLCRFDYWPLTGIVGAADYRNLAIAYGAAGDGVKARYYEKKAAAFVPGR